jgi:hypothetical protein
MPNSTGGSQKALAPGYFLNAPSGLISIHHSFANEMLAIPASLGAIHQKPNFETVPLPAHSNFSFDAHMHSYPAGNVPAIAH